MSLTQSSILLVVSSPSGAGKTTMTKALLAQAQGLVMSISVTTRPPRSGEVNGKDYIFVENRRFDEMRDGDAFLEHAHVFSHRYATARNDVMRHLDQGTDVLFDIDWQGAQQLREKMGKRMVSIFILPPSLCELRRRLHGRAQDDMAVVEKRMSMAKGEIAHWHEYDYVVFNNDLGKSVRVLESILMAERHRRNHRLVAGTDKAEITKALAVAKKHRRGQDPKVDAFVRSLSSPP